MNLPAQISSVLSCKAVAKVLCGDAYDILPQFPPESVDLLITSPPYWGLRDYEADHNWNILDDWKSNYNLNEIPSYSWYRENGGLLGLEPLPEWYISNLADFMDKGMRVLKPEGNLWLNIGDTYFARWSSIRSKGRQGLNKDDRHRRKTPMGGFRQEKQLLLIPSRVAIAMQDRRWILRNDLIWHKPNIPPRPFKDRLGSAHEHFFHFVKRPKEGRAKYYYDFAQAGDPAHDVVTLNVRAGSDGHSATFPEKLILPRILSSCPESGVVLDPFCGTGTALKVAIANSRRAIGIDMNQRFVEAAHRKTEKFQPLLF